MAGPFDIEKEQQRRTIYQEGYTDPLRVWREPREDPYYFASLMEGMGMTPFIYPSDTRPLQELHTKDDRDEYIERVQRFLVLARRAGFKHFEVKRKLMGYNTSQLFQAQGLQTIYMSYRDSIPKTEAPATLEFSFNYEDGLAPFYHARFFQFAHDNNNFMVVTALQRYTNEQLAELDEEFEGITPLKDLPFAWRGYHRKSKDIDRIEKATDIPMPVMILAACIGYGAANGIDRFLLTNYDNQYWVKENRNGASKVIVPNTYDPTAAFFGLVHSDTYPGFWELSKTQGLLTFPDNSPAIANMQSRAITQIAFDNFRSNLGT